MLLKSLMNYEWPPEACASLSPGAAFQWSWGRFSVELGPGSEASPVPRHQVWGGGGGFAGS